MFRAHGCPKHVEQLVEEKQRIQPEPIHGRTTCQPVLTTSLQPRHIPTRGYEPIHGRTTCQPVLTTSLQPRHIPTRDYDITQSSAPDDEHMVARNMLNNY